MVRVSVVCGCKGTSSTYLGAGIEQQTTYGSKYDTNSEEQRKYSLWGQNRSIEEGQRCDRQYHGIQDRDLLPSLQSLLSERGIYCLVVSIVL